MSAESTTLRVKLLDAHLPLSLTGKRVVTA